METKLKKKPVTLHLLSRNMYINPSEPSYYEKLLRVNRHNPHALYQLGRKAERAGDIAKAKQYYEKSASVASYQPAMGALLILKQKEIQEERKQEQKRREAYMMLDKWGNARHTRKGWRRRTMMQSLIIMLLLYLITITFVMGVLLK